MRRGWVMWLLLFSSSRVYLRASKGQDGGRFGHCHLSFKRIPCLYFKSIARKWPHQLIHSAGCQMIMFFCPRSLICPKILYSHCKIAQVVTSVGFDWSLCSLLYSLILGSGLEVDLRTCTICCKTARPSSSLPSTFLLQRYLQTWVEEGMGCLALTLNFCYSTYLEQVLSLCRLQ